MADGLRIEGFAIVSKDGNLAGSDGLMPDALKFERDQEFLDKSLDAATLIVHGRKSHEGQSNSHKRRRLLLTRSAGAFSTQPIEPNTWLWSPDATPFPKVCEALGINDGVVAILGGTSAYDLFLPHYAAFHLCRAAKVDLPGGVPVFSAVRDGHPPEAVFAAHGFALTEEETLHPEHGVRRQLWAREG